ncbi:hypothetical protein NDK25_07630 [Niallia taxi]|nr:cytochrome c biogenesis protein CcsA [Niallia taxi]MDE5052273.1 hypothetical protein [Niallia taxi]
MLTIMEGLYFSTWALVSYSLLANRLLKIDYIVLFTNVLGFLIMAIHTFAPMREGTEIAPQVISELLHIHITAASLASGGFSVSFIFSLLYCAEFPL